MFGRKKANKLIEDIDRYFDAAKAYFRSPETVPDKISSAYFYEKEAIW